MATIALEFVFANCLDNSSYDGRNIANVITKISGNDSSTAIISLLT